MYTHRSSWPISRLYDMPQNKEYELKPRGLWLSDDSDYGWEKWCKQSADYFIKDKLIYNVSLKEDANILWLRTPEDVSAFSYCYCMTGDIYDLLHMKPIDWYQVAQEYDGIMVTPYYFALRWSFSGVGPWYNAWDCSSGCIWNIRAIKDYSLASTPDEGTGLGGTADLSRPLTLRQ